jgi:hypothetical protein
MIQARMKRSLFEPAALPLILALAACASNPSRLQLGTTRAQALQQLGAPTATYPMPNGGERLQYSREPEGYEVTNVDLDAAGRVVAVIPELADPTLNSPIQIGTWREADVLRTFGKPYQISHVESFDGVIWSWQIIDQNQPRLFYVYFDPAGVVVRYLTGNNPALARVN